MCICIKPFIHSSISTCISTNVDHKYALCDILVTESITFGLRWTFTYGSIFEFTRELKAIIYETKIHFIFIRLYVTFVGYTFDW